MNTGVVSPVVTTPGVVSNNVVGTGTNNNHFWTGVGVGAGVGIGIGVGIGFYFAKKAVTKRAKEDVARIKETAAKREQRAYEDGVNEALAEGKKWIDEHKEELRKEFFEEAKSKNKSEVAEKIDENIASDEKNDEKMLEFEIKDYGTLSYPFRLFFDTKTNDQLAETVVRQNLREYEHDISKLKAIWRGLGWGEYYPDPADQTRDMQINPPNEEEINDWDLNIDGDEPYEKTVERQKFMDEIDRYVAHPEEAPRIISSDEFNDECYLDKIYVDYYDIDNIFVSNTEPDTELDAFTEFGVVNGNDLFKSNDDDSDPDITYVKNFKMNFVAEITRFHKSYQGIKDGSAYLDGRTDEIGGAVGV